MSPSDTLVIKEQELFITQEEYNYITGTLNSSTELHIWFIPPSRDLYFAAALHTVDNTGKNILNYHTGDVDTF